MNTPKPINVSPLGSVFAADEESRAALDEAKALGQQGPDWLTTFQIKTEDSTHVAYTLDGATRIGPIEFYGRGDAFTLSSTCPPLMFAVKIGKAFHILQGVVIPEKEGL